MAWSRHHSLISVHMAEPGTNSASSFPDAKDLPTISLHSKDPNLFLNSFTRGFPTVHIPGFRGLEVFMTL